MSDMENKDWINDYRALKMINPVSPFTVPEGYFDSLEGRIASFKNLAELKNDDLAGGFAVPENYFDELAGNIQSRINIEEAANREENSFAVPEGYFDNLTQQINSRIFVEDALGNTEEHFTVPQDYFAGLNSNILNKTVNQGTVKQHAVVRRLFASTAFKYATAACFALALGGGILLSELASTANDHQHSFLHKELSGVSADDIKSYLQLNLDPGDAQQTAISQGTPVDSDKLKEALEDEADSVQ